MHQWTRPYGQRFRASQLIYAVFFSVAWWSVLLCSVLYPFTSAGSAADNSRLPVGFAIVLVIGILFQLSVWRIRAIGLDVGEPGVRVRWFFHSLVIRWVDVHRVLIVDDPQYRGRAIVIIDRYGTRIPTPVWRREWLRRHLWLGRSAPPTIGRIDADELEALPQTLEAMTAERKRRVST